jgi:adenylosuccinate lyase
MALDYILSLFTGVMQGLKVYPERMMANIESTRGVVFSQRVLLELVANGLSREKAYDVTQRNALRSWDENLDFRQLLREEPDVTGVLSVQALDKLFDYGYYTRYVGETFERVGI